MEPTITVKDPAADTEYIMKRLSEEDESKVFAVLGTLSKTDDHIYIVSKIE